MAAPSFVGAGAGVVITTGSSGVSTANGAIDDLVILQVLQAGTAASAVSITPSSDIKNLGGTSSAMTALDVAQPFNVGGGAEARHWIWLGRLVNNFGGSITVATTGDDLYCRAYLFTAASLGTTLATVVENGGAVYQNAQATSASVADVGVTTNDVDRLAVNLIAVNDDNQLELTAMSGASGGTWAYPVTAFGSSTGTDGAIAIVTATMAAAGTINGATDAITSDPWGVVGFAILPIAAAAATDPRGAFAEAQVYNPAQARALLRVR